MDTTKQTRPEDEITFVFAGSGDQAADAGKCTDILSIWFGTIGLGDQAADAGKCDDECVGGTANTAAMQKTKP